MSEKYPSGRTVNMTVDNFGVTQTIADAQRTYVSGVTSNYSSTGMTSQITLGNGTVENFTMNERFQLTSQSLTRGGEVVQKFDYAYGQIDGAGNLDTAKNNGQLARIEAFIGAAKQRTQKFSYDSIGRLAKSEEYRGDTGALTYKQVFDFDRFGNLYRKSASNPTTGQQNPLPTNWIEDNQIDKSKNQFLSWTGVTYDDSGRITTDSKWSSAAFSYDANGRVIKTTKANTPDSHTAYDALGNRVATKINDTWQYMIYDAFGKLIAEYGLPSGGNGGVKFVQQDNLGSVRTVTNANGFVLARRDHQVFGEEIGAGIGLRTSTQGYTADTTARQGFGSTENDSSTGQQHTSFRKLETQSGRWTSPDPYNGSMNLSDPQSFNRYAYVGNDPLNFVDPSGLEMCSAEYSFSQCGGGGAFWGGGSFGDRVAQDAVIYEGLTQNSREGYNLYLERVSNASQGNGYITAAQLAQVQAIFQILYGAYDESDPQSANPHFELLGTFHYDELSSSGGLNDTARSLFHDLGRRGPALQNITNTMGAGALVVIAAPVVADLAGSLLARAAIDKAMQAALERAAVNPRIYAQLGKQFSQSGARSIFRALRGAEQALLEHVTKLPYMTYPSQVEGTIGNTASQVRTILQFISDHYLR